MNDGKMQAIQLVLKLAEVLNGMDEKADGVDGLVRAIEWEKVKAKLLDVADAVRAR